MKTRQLIAAVIALSSMATVGSAFADRSAAGPITNSTKTRAEVQAEFMQLRAEGLLGMVGEGDTLEETNRLSIGGGAISRNFVRTRKEVENEALEHVKNNRHNLSQSESS